MTVYIQYSNASNLQNLIAGLEPYLSISIEDFFTHYFNLATADTQGLNNWGRILELSRTIPVGQYDYIFGFDTGDVITNTIDYPQNFNHGTFYNGQTDSYELHNSAYRIFLKFRYNYLTCNMSMRAANDIVNTYIQEEYPDNPSYQCIVTTSDIRTIDFNFNFTLQPFEITIFAQPGILPVPVGIAYTVTQP